MPQLIWSNSEDDMLWQVFNLSRIESRQRSNILSQYLPSKTTNEIQVRFNSLKDLPASEEPWSKEDDYVLMNYVNSFTQEENETEWWINLYNNFLTKTWVKVNNMYQNLMNAIPVMMANDFDILEIEPDRAE